jgi:hypothetical protein
VLLAEVSQKTQVDLPTGSAVVLQPDLSALAATVRKAHQGVNLAAANLVEQALIAGDALIKAKDSVPYGGWLKWLKAECDLGEDRAENYMRIARSRGILEADSARARNLSLRGALELIRQKSPRSGSQRSRNRQPSKQPMQLASFGAAVAWWTNAPLEERRHLLDSVGSRAISEALPPSWNMTLIRNDAGEVGRLRARVAELENEVRERDRMIAALKDIPQDDAFLRDGRPMVADLKKGGIPLFLQVQNREPSRDSALTREASPPGEVAVTNLSSRQAPALFGVSPADVKQKLKTHTANGNGAHAESERGVGA